MQRFKAFIAESDKLAHGATHKGSKLYMNRTKSDRSHWSTHYSIHHADGKRHHFDVSVDDVEDKNPSVDKKRIAKKAGLKSSHPFVKTIHDSHTGMGSPDGWED